MAHLKTGPFKNRTKVDHLKTGHVRFSDPNFMLSASDDLRYFSSDGHNDEINSLSENEGTIIFHISQSIKMGHPVGKEVVKLLRNGLQIPEVVFGHFTLYLVR